jgi:hypothetical protein
MENNCDVRLLGRMTTCGARKFRSSTRLHQQAPFIGKALHVLAYLHVMLSTPLVVVYAGELPVYDDKLG